MQEAKIEVGTGGRKAETQVANWKRDAPERRRFRIRGRRDYPTIVSVEPDAEALPKLLEVKETFWN